MTGKEVLVRSLVGDESLGMAFKDALALAIQRDDAAGSEMKIQARELLGKNPLSLRWRWRKLKAKARFYIKRTGAVLAHLA